MSKEGEDHKHMESSDVMPSENSESEQHEEHMPPGVSEQVLQLSGEAALVDAVEQYAWKKLKYPPFSVSTVQEVGRWVRWAVGNNMQGMGDPDVRADLVRILHEGCTQYCERVADEIIAIGMRSAVDDHVVQFACETTQQKDVYLWHRIFNECEIYNVGLLRNVLKSPPQLERLREVIKQHSQKSDVWIELALKNMDNAFTQLSALAGVTALARSSAEGARLQLPAAELDAEALQRHLDLQRAMMVRPFMESDSAAKRRRKGWTTEEEEYIRQCIKLYKLAHPDKKTKRAPNELVHFIRSQPGAHVLQEGHDLDQNIKNKINDIYKKGFMYEA